MFGDIKTGDHGVVTMLDLPKEIDPYFSREGMKPKLNVEGDGILQASLSARSSRFSELHPADTLMSLASEQVISVNDKKRRIGKYRGQDTIFDPKAETQKVYKLQSVRTNY